MQNTFAQTAAWLRHAGTAAGAAVAVLAIVAGLSPDDQAKLLAAINQAIGGATNTLAALGTLTGLGMALYARFTSTPAQKVASVQAMPGLNVVPDGSAPIPPAVAAKLSSHWLVGLAAVLLLPFLAGGCMWTTSSGQQVVLTVGNATPLVIDQIKKACAAYDATKVTADALAAVAVSAINNTTVTGVTKTVQQIATDACPLIEALIQTQPAPAAKPASG